MKLDILSDQQRRVASDALTVEVGKRRHLVVYLSGSHSYGFPSPDSDIDLKAVHIAPTSALVGLHAPKPSADRLEVIDGVEIDYTSNELGPALAGLIGGNGNYLERVLGRLTVIESPELHELRPLCRSLISRKFYRHYAGFAKNQYHMAFKGSEVAAKKVLYVLRTALTGTHLMKTGELVTDVRELLDQYGLTEAAELIERKRSGERIALDTDMAGRWQARLTQLLATLEAARDESPLPPEPTNLAELEAWLLAVRKASW